MASLVTCRGCTHEAHEPGDCATFFEPHPSQYVPAKCMCNRAHPFTVVRENLAELRALGVPAPALDPIVRWLIDQEA